MESHSSCRYDSLTLRDSSGSASVFCGTDPEGTEYVSTENYLTVEFITDYSVTLSGFSLCYEAVDVPMVLPTGESDEVYI